MKQRRQVPLIEVGVIRLDIQGVIGIMLSRVSFLYKFFMKPTKISSITPSSSFLTKKMLEEILWDNIDTIVELGAGTGVFTNFIAQNKQTSCKVLIVEQDIKMREALYDHYPTFHFGTNAEKLDWLLEKYSLPQVECIISGLPFATFSEALRDQIMHAVNRSLKPGGVFVAFQYSLQMRKTFYNHFSVVNIDYVLRNLPPAFVYYCKK